VRVNVYLHSGSGDGIELPHDRLVYSARRRISSASSLRRHRVISAEAEPPDDSKQS
jgi:hypothetical protein